MADAVNTIAAEHIGLLQHTERMMTWRFVQRNQTLMRMAPTPMTNGNMIRKCGRRWQTASGKEVWGKWKTEQKP